MRWRAGGGYSDRYVSADVQTGRSDVLTLKIDPLNSFNHVIPFVDIPSLKTDLIPDIALVYIRAGSLTSRLLTQGIIVYH